MYAGDLFLGLHWQLNSNSATDVLLLAGLRALGADMLQQDELQLVDLVSFEHCKEVRKMWQLQQTVKSDSRLGSKYWYDGVLRYYYWWQAAVQVTKQS
jgi:hypothetical protein